MNYNGVEYNECDEVYPPAEDTFLLIDNLKVNDRGVKRENYQVLRESSCPSVLIETGFLSNPKEAYNLSKNKYQQKLAKSIANGIKEYLALND